MVNGTTIQGYTCVLHSILCRKGYEKQMNRLRLPSNENEIPVVKHEIKLNGILDVALLSTLED
jgi:hypothetical protein